jgi:hypothetical protein
MINVDLSGFDRQAAAVIRRVEEAFVAEYREIAMEIFWRLLQETPQFSGRAVAHWQVGIDAPDYFRDDNLGRVVNVLSPRHKKDGKFYKADSAYEKGDDTWANVAWMRNEHKFALIRRRTKVYFTNSVQGDTDMGAASENYMQALQDQGYWLRKLRPENQPYETVAQTIVLVQQQGIIKSRLGGGIATFRRTRNAGGI